MEPYCFHLRQFYKAKLMKFSRGSITFGRNDMPAFIKSMKGLKKFV